MDYYNEPYLNNAPFERYGVPERIVATSPAAGADFTQAVDGHDYARLNSLFVRLVTSAAVANRQLVLEYRDAGGNRWAVTGATAAQTATNTVDYFFSCFRPEEKTAIDGTTLLPLDPLVLLPSDNFRIHVALMDAGDQLSRIRFFWERFYSDVRIPGRDPASY